MTHRWGRGGCSRKGTELARDHKGVISEKATATIQQGLGCK